MCTWLAPPLTFMLCSLLHRNLYHGVEEFWVDVTDTGTSLLPLYLCFTLWRRERGRGVQKALRSGTRWRWVVSYTSAHLWRCGKRPRCALWRGGWVGPRAGLDAVEDGNHLLLLELGPYLPVARLVSINAILGCTRIILEWVVGSWLLHWIERLQDGIVVRAFALLVLSTCCTINLVVRREAVFSSVRSQLVLGAVDLELETLFPVTSTLCLLPVSISSINLFNCFSSVIVSATALDIALPNPSIIQSVKSVIELKRSDCAGGCFAACPFGTAVSKRWWMWVFFGFSSRWQHWKLSLRISPNTFFTSGGCLVSVNVCIQPLRSPYGIWGEQSGTGAFSANNAVFPLPHTILPVLYLWSGAGISRSNYQAAQLHLYPTTAATTTTCVCNLLEMREIGDYIYLLFPFYTSVCYSYRNSN